MIRLATTLSALLLAAPAFALQDPPVKPVDEPSLISQGVALRVQGQDAAAFDLFSIAWERYRTPRSQAQMGLAAQALGRWAIAETQLAGALLADDSWISGKRKTLEDALATVRKRLGSLEVLANVAEAQVLVDGQTVGQLPMSAPLRLPTGTVVLQVQASGYVPVQRSVMVEAGQLARESFQLVRSSGGPPPGGLSLAAAVSAPAVAEPVGAPLIATSDRPAATAFGGDTQRRAILYGAVGVAAAGIALSTWSGLDTLSARDRYVARPSEQLYRDGVSRQRRTNLLMVSTGLLAAGALAWALLAEWGSP